MRQCFSRSCCIYSHARALQAQGRRSTNRWRANKAHGHKTMKPKLKTFPHFQLLGRIVAVAAAMLALSTPHLFAGDLNVTYITGAEVPVSSNGFTAMEKKVNITLNFAPAPGTQLMVVQNTGRG